MKYNYGLHFNSKKFSYAKALYPILDDALQMIKDEYRGKTYDERDLNKFMLSINYKWDDGKLYLICIVMQKDTCDFICVVHKIDTNDNYNISVAMHNYFDTTDVPKIDELIKNDSFDYINNRDNISASYTNASSAERQLAHPCYISHHDIDKKFMQVGYLFNHIMHKWCNYLINSRKLLIKCTVK